MQATSGRRPGPGAGPEPGACAPRITGEAAAPAASTQAGRRGRSARCRGIAVAVLATTCAGPPAATAQASLADESVDFHGLLGGLRGRESSTWTAALGFIYRPAGSRWGLGFVYVNDGHLPNHHRDGFAAQGWYVRPAGDRLELQIGAGPYASMSNTDIDGRRFNEFRGGLLGSVALKWHGLGDGWYLRAQFNATAMAHSFGATALLVGIGHDCPPRTGRDEDAPGRLRSDIGVWSGISRTTTLGPQRNAGSALVEAQFLPDADGAWWTPSAYSVAFLSEGDTFITDRKGLPVQAWWRTPPARVVFGFGVGPYAAYDTRRAQRLELLGILSLRAAVGIHETAHMRFEAALMFSRVASFYNKDQDIYLAGIRLYEKR